MTFALKPNYSPRIIKAFFAAYLIGCLSVCAVFLAGGELNRESVFFAAMACLFALMPTMAASVIALILLYYLRLLYAWCFVIVGAAMPSIIFLATLGRITEGLTSMAVLTLGGAIGGWVFWRISQPMLEENARKDSPPAA